MTLCPSTSRSPRIAARVTSSLALTRDRGYDGQRMGADTVQPSRRLDYPTTRLPDYRAPLAAQPTTQRRAGRRRC